ncbi:hypothetical protein N0M98_01585 [Paenibacillus doosanensis]|uniref:Restriction endonuclease subunit S n=1 Tax=Paenibacillus konkukensis TaxID=2020716 RepID=A0ABY4RZ73_9BACL|nr:MULTISPECIES: hypothetical protein [Paenibacillus]MCS7458818.1 hypothetical protein [Paenibacillus doosanensis]UQZ86654.1 hypothetical protein SK3146_05947 [Paenibacillus konkukensis]
MSRSDSYYKMMQAAVKFHHNIALILEAKAAEATRSCQWICNHVSPQQFDDHSKQVRRAIEVHEQLIEVIEGLTRMEQALSKNMSVLLGDDEESSDSGGEAGVGDLFPFGGGSK